MVVYHPVSSKARGSFAFFRLGMTLKMIFFKNSGLENRGTWWNQQKWRGTTKPKIYIYIQGYTRMIRIKI